MDKQESVSLTECRRSVNAALGNKYQMGQFGRYAGVVLILLFALILFPLYLFLWITNKLYFRIVNEKPVDPRPFFHFDRHKIAHLNFIDRLACEYCELANGTLQWGLEMANRIEHRHCPIQNSCEAQCEKVKVWRKDFVPFNYSTEELERYYRDYLGTKR